jgi:predicted nucleotide-binding protein (sugar kinase/HSP70/actin superfamily)
MAFYNDAHRAAYERDWKERQEKQQARRAAQELIEQQRKANRMPVVLDRQYYVIREETNAILTKSNNLHRLAAVIGCRPGDVARAIKNGTAVKYNGTYRIKPVE